MQKAHEHETGIDLFDFIYEVWRGKWIFAGILILCLAAGFASVLMQSTATPLAPIESSKVEFSLDYLNDPAQRKPEQIISDFLTLWTSDKSLQLTNAESASLGVTMTSNNYRISYSDGANVGVITVTAPGQQPAYFDRAYAAMQRAAQTQFENMKRQLQADLSVISRIREGAYTGDSEVLSRGIYIASRFLDFPTVADGTWRFVKLREMNTYSAAGASGGSGLSRRLLIAGIAGLLIASLAIMFRIAIERRRVRDAAA